MTFDYAEYLAFVQFLYKHPELRAEVRKVVLSEDILTLPQVVRELAEAQKRTEQRVEELAEAQKRSEAAGATETTVAELAEAQKRSEERLTRLETTVAELAEAQKRSEERLTRLETTVAELAETQKRTEQRVEELAQAQRELAEAQKRTDERLTRVEQRMDSLEIEMKKTRSEVAGLAAAFGSTLEEEAASVVESVMRRKGYRLLEEATTLRFNGDVDVALPVETARGKRLLVVVRSKARLGRRDVIAWHQRVQSPGWQQRMAEAGYPGPSTWCIATPSAPMRARAMRCMEARNRAAEERREVIAPAGELGE